MVYGLDAGILTSPADRLTRNARARQNVKRAIKLLAYGFYFIIITSLLVINKYTLLMMTTAYGNNNSSVEIRSRWSLILAVSICVPYLFTFLESIAYSLFRSRKGPSFSDMLIILVLESLHTFGLCTLIYRILPSLDYMRALLILPACCTIPALCKLLFARAPNSSKMSIGRVVSGFFDLLALIAQISAIIIILQSPYTPWLNKDYSAVQPAKPPMSVPVDTNSFPTNNFDSPMNEFDPFLQTNEDDDLLGPMTGAILQLKRSKRSFNGTVNRRSSGLNGTINKRSSELNDIMNKKSSRLNATYSKQFMMDDTESMTIRTSKRQQFPWEIIVVLLLSTLSYWENYVDRNVKLGKFIIPIGNFKRHLQTIRSKANVGVSLYKIGLTIAFCFLLAPGDKSFVDVFVNLPKPPEIEPVLSNEFNIPNFRYRRSVELNSNISSNSTTITHIQQSSTITNIVKLNNMTNLLKSTTTMGPLAQAQVGMNIDQFNIPSINSNDNGILLPDDMTNMMNHKEMTVDEWWRTVYPYIPVILHFISSFLTYYFGKSACQMCMQRLSFALPLTLATPTSIAIGILAQSNKWFPQSGESAGERLVFLPDVLWLECPEPFGSSKVLTWQLTCALCLWWLSQVWISIHIWFPENKRLALTETLFVIPQYCSIMLEQCLLLNRRRNEKEHIKNEIAEQLAETEIFRERAHALKKQQKKNKNVDHIEGLTQLEETEEDLFQDGENPQHFIYVCGTLWHESISEMIQLLKSIMRLDIDQSARRKAKEYFKVNDPDYYELETNIFFDDAFIKDENGERQINGYVRDLIQAMDRAAAIIHDIDNMRMTPPTLTPAPYGGRLTWKLPGGNLLKVHLKDRLKTQRRKRWSIVMCLYYVLGYNLLGECENRLRVLQTMLAKDARLIKMAKKHDSKIDGINCRLYYKDVLGPQRLLKSENLFILLLDGDVDFNPDSVKMLLDKMKKDKRVAAVTGRIHPIGFGPMIWYQKMEYALNYWLQKTTEHTLGCVFCATGCFSLFRGSALLDDNVLRTVADNCETAEDYILNDMGEDRWLSRLLVERGYKIEYCAASDAYTHAPETFTEYFQQRRRWIPSTLGHTVKLLGKYKHIIRRNEHISFLYIFYHILLLISTILAPATITIAIADAFHATTDISMWYAFMLSLSPAVVYIIVCFQDSWKDEAKVGIGAMLGTYYSVLMMIVVVGVMVRMFEGSWKTTAALIFIVMGVIFLLTAICHPFELGCVRSSILFFLCIPTAYILLTIYALCNLHSCAWGTREEHSQLNSNLKRKRHNINRKVKTKNNFIKLPGIVDGINKANRNADITHIIRDAAERAKKSGVGTSEEIMVQILSSLEKVEIRRAIEQRLMSMGPDDIEKEIFNLLNGKTKVDKNCKSIIENDGTNRQLFNEEAQLNKNEMAKRNDMVNPAWIDNKTSYYQGLVNDNNIYGKTIYDTGNIFRHADYEAMGKCEIDFWNGLLQLYVNPNLTKDGSKKARILKDMRNLRDKSVFAFFMLNALWIAFVFPVLLAQERLGDMIYIPISLPSLYYQNIQIEPLGVIHLILFSAICVTQFISMLCHRYQTFQHILASTKLKPDIHEGLRIEDIIDTVKLLQQIKPIDETAEPIPDYSDVEESNDENNKEIDENNLKKQLERGVDNEAFENDGEDILISKGRKRMISNQISEQDDVSLKYRSIRSRNLEQKNSLDIYFKKRLNAVLKDTNKTTNNDLLDSTNAISTICAEEQQLGGRMRRNDHSTIHINDWKDENGSFVGSQNSSYIQSAYYDKKKLSKIIQHAAQSMHNMNKISSQISANYEPSKYQMVETIHSLQQQQQQQQQQRPEHRRKKSSHRMNDPLPPPGKSAQFNSKKNKSIISNDLKSNFDGRTLETVTCHTNDRYLVDKYNEPSKDEKISKRHKSRKVTKQ
ncbi:hypothetical protein SNEBB_001269 [Seison nebaliae]|nr:hypothetical protein SNEBB_001269 [Seison nebaliae]